MKTLWIKSLGTFKKGGVEQAFLNSVVFAASIYPSPF